jgi:SagB-type dehydrogenase family enzyme
MKIGLYLFVIITATIIACSLFLPRESNVMEEKEPLKKITLPEPKIDVSFPLTKAILSRRSARTYKDKSLTLEQVSQLLWAAQGITSQDGLRAAPSAGALYPMEVYIVVGKVEQLDAGVYKYNCKSHSLSLIKKGDSRSELSLAALGQSSVSNGMIDIVICGIYERTQIKYGSRAKQYVHMEAGHISQNIYLTGVMLGLGTVAVGAFDDEAVKKIVAAQSNEQPLYIMPVGSLQ